MGKHHRRSNFARNAAAFGATVAGVTALTVPAATADPISDFIGNTPVAGLLQSVNSGTPFLAGGQAAPQGGAAIVDAARSQIGTPYVWGGNQPGGFDCSGLTSWAYQQVGKSIPRTSQAQASSGTPVSTPQLGDIVSFYSGASHVGIFSGNGNIIHAPQSGDVVKEASMNYMPVHNIVRF
nr:NlpC/P60 family protein [Corynebacterium lactis]